eukprot:Pompholyxophrys_punicea_v1_NODE_110_length_3422_cov_27.309177.p4 type:complete len:141 gc:universal NODE_110_length_3422_cov_27.309177:2893-3315(+)
MPSAKVTDCSTRSVVAEGHASSDVQNRKNKIVGGDGAQSIRTGWDDHGYFPPNQKRKNGALDVQVTNNFPPRRRRCRCRCRRRVMPRREQNSLSAPIPNSIRGGRHKDHRPPLPGKVRILCCRRISTNAVPHGGIDYAFR